MTHIYQVLDLIVNGCAKRFTRKKFNEWYTNQVRQQLDEGKEVAQIEFKLTRTTLKPIHAKWLVDLYNPMTTPEGEQVISSGWSAAGIISALKSTNNKVFTITSSQHPPRLLRMSSKDY